MLLGDMFDENRSRSKGEVDYAGEKQGDLKSEQLLRKEGKLLIAAVREQPMAERAALWL